MTLWSVAANATLILAAMDSGKEMTRNKVIQKKLKAVAGSKES